MHCSARSKLPAQRAIGHAARASGVAKRICVIAGLRKFDQASSAKSPSHALEDLAATGSGARVSHRLLVKMKSTIRDPGSAPAS